MSGWMTERDIHRMSWAKDACGSLSSQRPRTGCQMHETGDATNGDGRHSPCKKLEDLLVDFSAVIDNFHPGTAGTSLDVLLTKDCIEKRNLMPARTSVTGRHMACIEQGTVPPPLAFRRHAPCKKPQVPRRWNTVKSSQPLHRASHAPPGLESLFEKSAGGLSRSI